MVYLFDVYALVVITVSVVALGVWFVSYASLVGGVFVTRLLRVAAANLSRRKNRFSDLYHQEFAAAVLRKNFIRQR